MRYNCEKEIHRLRENMFGVTWCTKCGRLAIRPSKKPLDCNFLLQESEDAYNESKLKKT